MSFSSKKNKPLVFIDVGHAKCRMVVLSSNLSSMKLFETVTAGFAKGKVTDRNALTSSIQHLATISGIIGSDYFAILNIPATHTRTIIQTVNYRLSGHYRPADYGAIIDKGLECSLGGLDEVIDIIPIQCKADGQTIDPIGFGKFWHEGNFRFMLATHPSLLLSDLLACVNSAGIEVSEFRSNAFGVSRALQYLRASSENSVLLDVGHSTVTGAMMVGGLINQVFCVPAGSAHITRDLATGLGVSMEDAEFLKVQKGILQALNGADHSRKILAIAIPRVAELFSLAFKHFAIYRKCLDGGILLSGGGSSLSGLTSFLSSRFGINSPFVAQLTNSGAKTFVGLTVNDNSTEQGSMPEEIRIDSGWISVLSHARAHVLHRKAVIEERNVRPLSRLQPLWTWLSELSR